jgi:hypothetical protein
MLIEVNLHSTDLMPLYHKRYIDILEEITRNVDNIRMERVSCSHKHFSPQILSYLSIVKAIRSLTFAYA